MKPITVLSLVILAGFQLVSAESIFGNAKPVTPPLPFKEFFFKESLRNIVDSPLAAPHIAGGSEVTPYSHPHQVGLKLQIIGKDGFCGGSLISDTWVLTAGHCVDKNVLMADFEEDFSDIELIAEAFVGAHTVMDLADPGYQKVNASEIITHPEYNIFRLKNDIALLKLEESVIADGYYVKPIRLPKVSQKVESFYNAQVSATGWGAVKRQGYQSDILRELNSRVVSNFYCNFRYLFLVVRETHICTSGWWAKGTCHGDSGGPLVLREQDGQPTLIGITSFSFGCSWTWPSVYTRVTSYLDWIHATTGIAPRD